MFLITLFTNLASGPSTIKPGDRIGGILGFLFPNLNRGK